jgi:hypothetical protein
MYTICRSSIVSDLFFFRVFYIGCYGGSGWNKKTNNGNEPEFGMSKFTGIINKNNP